MDISISQEIQDLKDRANKYINCINEEVDVDHVVYGRDCTILKSPLGAYTPCAEPITVGGCRRGKIYKRTPKQPDVSKYIFDVNNRLITVIDDEYNHHYFTKIVYENSIMYAFQWSNPENTADISLVSISVCRYVNNQIVSWYLLDPKVGDVRYQVFDYENGIVSRVSVYRYHAWMSPERFVGENGHLFPNLSLATSVAKRLKQPEFYSQWKPVQRHVFTAEEVSDLTPFLGMELGKAVFPKPRRKVWESWDSQYLHKVWLADHASEEMTLDELIDVFRKMLSNAAGKDEKLLFQTVESYIGEERTFCLDLVRQIPVTKGKFEQLHFMLHYSSKAEYARLNENKWFEAANKNDESYLDGFITYIRGSRIYAILNSERILSVDVELSCI